MKSNVLPLPMPDEELTGIQALKLLQTKSKKDRRFFNKFVQRSREGDGYGGLVVPDLQKKRNALF